MRLLLITAFFVSFVAACMLGVSGHVVLSVLLFAFSVGVGIWLLLTPPSKGFRTMTNAERKSQADCCSDWDWTNDSTED